MIARLKGIRKDFSKIAFIGPNPEMFLLNMQEFQSVQKFVFMEPSQKAVEVSYRQISKSIESGFLEKNGVN